MNHQLDPDAVVAATRAADPSIGTSRVRQIIAAYLDAAEAYLIRPADLETLLSAAYLAGCDPAADEIERRVTGNPEAGGHVRNVRTADWDNEA